MALAVSFGNSMNSLHLILERSIAWALPPPPRTERRQQELRLRCSGKPGDSGDHAALQSGRIGPETPSKAPSASSQTSSRAGSTGPGMTARPFGTRLEAGLAVIGLVAHQHDQPMAFGFRFRERALDQGVADAALAKRRLDRQRTEQQRLGLADPDRREPDRADQQRADARGKRKFEPMPHPLAQAVGRLGVAAGPKVRSCRRSIGTASSAVSGRMVRDRSVIGDLPGSAISIWQAGGPSFRGR